MSLPSYAKNQTTFPEMYEQWLAGPLFRPWAEITLDAVNLTAGDRVLDIACGTGIVARVARERLGPTATIVGVDVSPDMLAVARKVGPDIEWRQGNASSLPLHDGERYDVVVCQQGLQFFPDKPVAVAEMRRAIAPEGRIAVATWCSDEDTPFFHELRTIAEKRLGKIVDQRHSFGDADPLEALLRGAGFREVECRTISRTLHFNDGAPLLRLNTMALVGMSAAGKAMGEDERKSAVEAVIDESAPVLKSYAESAGIAFDISANLATAKSF